MSLYIMPNNPLKITPLAIDCVIYMLAIILRQPKVFLKRQNIHLPTLEVFQLKEGFWNCFPLKKTSYIPVTNNEQSFQNYYTS